MTTHQYITQKLGSFGIKVSEVDLLGVVSEEVTADVKSDVEREILKMIPELLLRPNISESGFSVSYDKKAITSYYNLKCKELGVENLLTPRVTFL